MPVPKELKKGMNDIDDEKSCFVYPAPNTLHNWRE
jgi:hypothetical protein